MSPCKTIKSFVGGHITLKLLSNRCNFNLFAGAHIISVLSSCKAFNWFIDRYYIGFGRNECNVVQFCIGLTIDVKIINLLH